MGFQLKPIIIPATGTGEIPMKGNFIQVRAATGILTVTTDKNETDQLVANEVSRFDKPFSSVRITSTVIDDPVVLSVGYGYKSFTQTLTLVVPPGTPITGQFPEGSHPIFPTIWPFIMGIVNRVTRLVSPASTEDDTSLTVGELRVDIPHFGQAPGTGSDIPIVYTKEMATMHVTINTPGDVLQCVGRIVSAGGIVAQPIIYEVETGFPVATPIAATGNYFFFTEGFNVIHFAAPGGNATPVDIYLSFSRACRRALTPIQIEGTNALAPGFHDAEVWPDPGTANNGGPGLNVNSRTLGYDPTGWNAIRMVMPSDSNINGYATLAVAAFNQLYEPSTNRWWLERMNDHIDLITPGTYAATQSSPDQVNVNWRGLRIFFNVSAVPGLDTVTLSIEIRDPVSGLYFPILTGAPVALAGTYAYSVYPGTTNVAGLVVSDCLAKIFRVTITHSAATNFDYSVSGDLLV